MAIELLEEIEGNEAFFENDEIQGQDEGHISWSEPELIETNKYRVVFSGTNVVGGTIPSTQTAINQSTTPTPAQVFFAIAAALTSLLCPDCGGVE